MPLYKQDPNNTSTQIPNGIQGTQYSSADCPAHSTVTKRPSYVNINMSGTYAFLYETTASVGGTTVAEGYITGSVVESANAGAVKLDISPVAWRQVDGANAGGTVGDVTFVYVRVR